VAHTNALGSLSATNSIQAATLDLNGFDIGNRIITLQDNASRLVNDNTNSAAAASGPVNMLTNRSNAQIGGNGNLTLSGSMATQDGTGGGFTKVGTGILTLGGSNNYSGTTTISAGSLRLNNANALGGSTNVRYTATSGLDLNGFSVSGKTLTSVTADQTGFLTNSTATKSTWLGDVQLTSGNVRAGGTNAEVEIGGVISGSGQLQSLDGGTLRLTGDNTYSGTTSVRDGSKLIVSHANALGSLSSTNFIQAATLDLNGFDIGSRIITLQDNASRLVNDNTTNGAAVSGPINMLTNRSNAQIGGDGNLTLSGNMSTQDGTAGGFTKVGSGTLTLAGTTFYGGNTVVESGQLVLATNGSLRFVIGGSGTNNAVLGSGNAVMNGWFAFDLASASTNTNATWTIVTNTLVETYGASFIVSGFSGNAASGLWTNTTNGVDYVFSQSSGVLSVQPASSVPPYNAWVAFWQTNSAGFTNTAGTDNPDGDPFNNNMEFAFDGNPTVGTPALMTVTPVGSNAVFNWIERTNGVIYEVQKNSTLTNAWAAATGLSISNSTNTSNVLPAPAYVQKEFIITNATGKDFYRVRATIQP
jgi:autotransporter-associated beta strand protein